MAITHIYACDFCGRQTGSGDNLARTETGVAICEPCARFCLRALESAQADCLVPIKNPTPTPSQAEVVRG